MSAQMRHHQILDETQQLVDSEGFYAATIERIAERCGVTRTLIYQQFGSLPKLLVAMVDREFNRAAKGLVEAMNNTPPNKQDQFLFTLAGILDAVDKAPATWRMFLMPSEGGPPELYQHLAKAVEFTHGFLTASFYELKAETTHLTDADPELTVRVMHAIGDELVKLRLKQPEKYSNERLLTQAEWVSRSLFSAKP